MEMSIEEEVKNIKEQLADVSTKYRMMQANYNARLKADLKAILVELQMKIEEIEIDLPFGFEPVTKTEAFYQGVSESSKVIKQRINELEVEQDPTPQI